MQNAPFFVHRVPAPEGRLVGGEFVIHDDILSGLIGCLGIQLDRRLYELELQPTGAEKEQPSD
jgi:hypothetical protein